MKYNVGENKIETELSEFVGIARRKISSSLPFDVDEPRNLKGKRKNSGEILTYSFTLDSIAYELKCRADLTEKGELLIEKILDSSPKRPKKEEVAQARGEAYVLAYVWLKIKQTDSVSILFKYVGAMTGETVTKVETPGERRLTQFFNRCAEAIRIYAAPEINRVKERLPSLASLKFPYKSIREAQREFIGTAYRILARGGKLYASAPTGTGKTVSALYPALRAMGDGRVDKVFYFTPKGTTAEAARECLELMERNGAKVKAVILNAKDKCCTQGRVCKMSRKLCKNAACNNLSEATLDLFNSEITVIDSRKIVEISEKYNVCPYELSLTYAELCDVVICDFNYLFDPFAYIRRFFERTGKYAFLVDEAHNLAERVRESYTAEICCKDIGYLADEELLGEFSKLKAAAIKAEESFLECLYPLVKEEIRENDKGKKEGAAHHKSVPEQLFTIAADLISIAEEELLDNYKAEDEEKEQRIAIIHEYYYRLKSFYDILSLFNDSYEMFVFYEDGEIKIKLFCLDTGEIVKERLSKGHSALLFSATLSPISYYRATLGGDRSDSTLELASPFDPSQLAVCIMDRISTRFSERESTMSAVMRVIAATISAKRGNYIVFCPSLAYCETLSKIFRAKYPKMRVITQKRNMKSEEKEEFLHEFKKDDRSYLVAFAVMGGIYSEGIDLAGDSLIGAIVIGIGMPALSYEREAIAAYYDEKYEEGKQYAYIYPGMNRVFQAAGRVIRREDDKGVIVLIDDRFDDPIYKKSLPDLWEGLKYIEDAKTLNEELLNFWNEESR